MVCWRCRSERRQAYANDCGAVPDFRDRPAVIVMSHAARRTVDQQTRSRGEHWPGLVPRLVSGEVEDRMQVAGCFQHADAGQGDEEEPGPQQ
jgi:hypothetical protein